MNLRNYLIKNKISQRQFALDLGIHWKHLSNIIGGRRYPSATLAFKIEEKTNGAVTALDLLKRKSE